MALDRRYELDRDHRACERHRDRDRVVRCRHRGRRHDREDRRRRVAELRRHDVVLERRAVPGRTPIATRTSSCSVSASHRTAPSSPSARRARTRDPTGDPSATPQPTVSIGKYSRPPRAQETGRCSGSRRSARPDSSSWAIWAATASTGPARSRDPPPDLQAIIDERVSSTHDPRTERRAERRRSARAVRSRTGREEWERDCRTEVARFECACPDPVRRVLTG